ncbi:hypothetical protein EDB85DRAFT_2290121 [Lactarius pseudohatsudake]|nr:hypothetical protein EDB85DRAFT_2290121 [Lactarius pseudohatsudake]
MLTGAFMRSLTGPTPTPFTGDPAQAVQFLDEFGQLVRANQAHLLVTRPELRVELALSFIRGQTTNAWKRIVPRRRTAEPADETLWDDFIDSFCVTWVDPPASLPVIMTAPPPHPLRSPRHPFSPRLASLIASTLDLVKPVDELPPTHPVSAPARAGDLVIPVHGANNATTVPSPVAPSTLVPDVDGVIDLTGSDLDEWALFAPRTKLTTSLAISAATHDESYDLPLPLTVTPDPLATASAAQRAEGRPITAPVNHNHEGTLIAPHVPTLTPAVPALIDSDAHAADGIAPKRKLNQGHDADDAETRPSKRIRAQLARRSVPLPRKVRYVRRRPVAPPPPVDNSSGLSDPTLNTQYPAQPARPQPSPPSPVFTPPSPRTVVEDDNSLRRGVKTLDTSGLAPGFVVSPVPTSPATRLEPPADTQTNIFPRHAFERPREPDELAGQTRVVHALKRSGHAHTRTARHVSPLDDTSSTTSSRRTRKRSRDPDEVAPATPQPVSQRRHRANAAVINPRPPNSEATRDRDEHTDTAHRTNETATYAARESAQHDRYRPYPRRAQPPSHSPRDLDKPADEPPDALAKRRAIDTFLKNYDAARTVQKPTPAKDDRAYDAVTQHLDRWLWRDPDRCYLSHPFHLHHVVVPHATIGPQQSKNTKTEDAEPPQRSKQSQSHSPGHIRKTRIRHALTHEERRRYRTEGHDCN